MIDALDKIENIKSIQNVAEYHKNFGKHFGTARFLKERKEKSFVLLVKVELVRTKCGLQKFF